MSNFWANALGVQTPAPAPQQAPVVQPWFAPPTYQQPAQPQPFQPAAPQPQQAVAPVEQQQGGWGTIEGSTRRAKSARLNDMCPECGSTNYFRPEGHPSAMAQCYSCGYNPRFSQTGGQGGLPGGDAQAAPATPARQTAAGGGGGSQFRPDVIVGHV